MNDYSELKKLAGKATLGPYEVLFGKSIASSSQRKIVFEGNGCDREDDLKYMAAANPATIINMLEEIEALRKDAARFRWLRENEFDIGSYHPTHEHNASAWFESFTDESIDEAIAFEADHK